MSDNFVWIPSDQTKCHHSMYHVGKKMLLKKNKLSWKNDSLLLQYFKQSKTRYRNHCMKYRKNLIIVVVKMMKSILTFYVPHNCPGGCNIPAKPRSQKWVLPLPTSVHIWCVANVSIPNVLFTAICDLGK